MWVSCRGTGADSKAAPVWTPLPMELQVLPRACFSAGFPWGHSFLRAPACSGMLSARTCRGISAPTPGTPRPLPSSLSPMPSKLFLSHVLIPLSQLLLHRSFCPFLICHHRGTTNTGSFAEATSSPLPTLPHQILVTLTQRNDNFTLKACHFLGEVLSGHK